MIKVRNIVKQGLIVGRRSWRDLTWVIGQSRMVVKVWKFGLVCMVVDVSKLGWW